MQQTIAKVKEAAKRAMKLQQTLEKAFRGFFLVSKPSKIVATRSLKAVLHRFDP